MIDFLSYISEIAFILMICYPSKPFSMIYVTFIKAYCFKLSYWLIFSATEQKVSTFSESDSQKWLVLISSNKLINYLKIKNLIFDSTLNMLNWWVTPENIYYYMYSNIFHNYSVSVGNVKNKIISKHKIS